MASDGLTDNSVTIPSTAIAVEQLCGRIVAELAAAGFAEDDLFAIHLSLEEALLNAARHGNGLDPQKAIHVRWHIDSEQFEIEIADEGQGFVPDDLPDPTQEENLYKFGGRGVL